jgi:hypothetical protein
LCLPCCFDKYNTEGRITANKKCYGEKIEEKEDKKNKKQEDREEDEYIKGPDKFPLEPGRWGYLPVGIQTMLHEANADCQISKTNSNIKENQACLLRHGVDYFSHGNSKAQFRSDKRKRVTSCLRSQSRRPRKARVHFDNVILQRSRMKS